MFPYLLNPFCSLQLSYNREADIKMAKDNVVGRTGEVEAGKLAVLEVRKHLVNTAGNGAVSVQDVLSVAGDLERAARILDVKVSCLEQAESYLQSVNEAVETEAYANAAKYICDEGAYHARCAVEDAKNEEAAQMILSKLDATIEAKMGTNVLCNRVKRPETTFVAGELVGCTYSVFSNGRMHCEEWYYRVIVLRALEDGYYFIANGKADEREFHVVHGSSLVKLALIEGRD